MNRNSAWKTWRRSSRATGARRRARRRRHRWTRCLPSSGNRRDERERSATRVRVTVPSIIPLQRLAEQLPPALLLGVAQDRLELAFVLMADLQHLRADGLGVAPGLRLANQRLDLAL